jgi:sphingolipid C9-methyltransferase
VAADDFYNAFLGSTMVYTGGIRLSENDTLAQMQYQKIELVCRKIQLQQGQRLLDIGCGWGSLTLQATKNYGVCACPWVLSLSPLRLTWFPARQAQCTGVTLSSEQVKWAEEVASRRGINCPRFLRMDYRDIPREKFDRVTCLEMAEHVGVKNFTTFLLQVRIGRFDVAA